MLLDTSTLVEFFNGTERGKQVSEILSSEECCVSALSIAEIAKWCIENKLNPEDFIRITKNIAEVVEPNESIYKNAAAITCDVKSRLKRKKFGLMDGLILATARAVNQKALTKDAHWEGLEGVEML